MARRNSIVDKGSEKKSREDASSASIRTESIAVTEEEASLCICMEFILDKTEDGCARDTLFVKVIAIVGRTTGVTIEQY